MTREQLAAIAVDSERKPTIHGRISEDGEYITLRFPKSVPLTDVRSNSKGNAMLCVHFNGPQEVIIEGAAERDGEEVNLPMSFRGAVLNLNLA
jgi:hypothetical protein